MPTMVTINGVAVDMEDPCAVATELRKVELLIVTGAGVVMVRFVDHEVQFGKANLANLRELIAQYERSCEAKSGRRSRYAKRLRFVR
jgi:hypothetical protein